MPDMLTSFRGVLGAKVLRSRDMAFDRTMAPDVKLSEGLGREKYMIITTRMQKIALLFFCFLSIVKPCLRVFV